VVTGPGMHAFPRNLIGISLVRDPLRGGGD
jgi:hypothetical protein